MSGADRITVAAFSKGFCKKPIKIGAVFGDFDFIKNGDGVDVAILVEVINLFSVERGGMGNGTWVETKIALDILEVRLVWGNFKI